MRLARRRLQGDPDLVRAGMSHDVRNGLARDPQHLSSERGRQVVGLGSFDQQMRLDQGLHEALAQHCGHRVGQ